MRFALGSKGRRQGGGPRPKRALEEFRRQPRERVALLSTDIEVYKTRMKDIGAASTTKWARR